MKKHLLIFTVIFSCFISSLTMEQNSKSYLPDLPPDAWVLILEYSNSIEYLVNENAHTEQEIFENLEKLRLICTSLRTATNRFLQKNFLKLLPENKAYSDYKVSIMHKVIAKKTRALYKFSTENDKKIGLNKLHEYKKKMVWRAIKLKADNWLKFRIRACKHENDNFISALYKIMIECKKIHTFEFLLKAGLSPNGTIKNDASTIYNDRSILNIITASEKSALWVKLLLENGADPNSKSYGPPILALVLDTLKEIAEPVEKVKLLLQHGANCNHDDIERAQSWIDYYTQIPISDEIEYNAQELCKKLEEIKILLRDHLKSRKGFMNQAIFWVGEAKNLLKNT